MSKLIFEWWYLSVFKLVFFTNALWSIWNRGASRWAWSSWDLRTSVTIHSLILWESRLLFPTAHRCCSFLLTSTRAFIRLLSFWECRSSSSYSWLSTSNRSACATTATFLFLSFKNIINQVRYYRTGTHLNIFSSFHNILPRLRLLLKTVCVRRGWLDLINRSLNSTSKSRINVKIVLWRGG